MWYALVYIIWNKIMSFTAYMSVFGDGLWTGQKNLVQAAASMNASESLPPLRFEWLTLETLASIVFYTLEYKMTAYFIRQGTEPTEDAWFWAATRWVLVHALLCATFYAITSTSRYCLGFIERTFVSPLLRWAPGTLTRASKGLQNFIALIKFISVPVHLSESLSRRPLKLQDLPNASDGIWKTIKVGKLMVAMTFRNTATWQRTLACYIVWVCFTARKALDLEFVHPTVASDICELASAMQSFVSLTVELMERGLLWLANAARDYNAANDATNDAT